MKAKVGVVDFLNKVLTSELTAVHQYLLHAGLCRNWGYHRLHDKFESLAKDEMGHSAQLIEHILYLEGKPNLQALETVASGKTVIELLKADLDFEVGDVDLLRNAITHCTKAGDFTTRHKLEEMVKDTEEHVDWFETQLRAISQVGVENYLSEQIKK